MLEDGQLNKRFLVFMLRLPSYDPAMLSPHKNYLEKLWDEGCLELTGPFADGKGGAYLLRAKDMATALQVAHADPAYASGGWQIDVYEWQTR